MQHTHQDLLRESYFVKGCFFFSWHKLNAQHLIPFTFDSLRSKDFAEIFTKSQSRLYSFGLSFSFFLCCFPLEKDKSNQIIPNFPSCSPNPSSRKPYKTIALSSPLAPHPMPPVFILSLFIRFSASVQSQTSQPLTWVKRRKWAFGPGGTVYKELVRFQRRFEVSSTQETVCH